ncbi:MAG: hypothetical protein AB7K41_04670 [Bdellovibrionales bacterium]
MGTAWEASPALAKWKMANGVELVACGNSESKTAQGLSGWFNIYWNREGQLQPYLAEVTSELPSAFYYFATEKISDQSIVLSRRINSSGRPRSNQDVIATEIAIVCDSKTCNLQKEICRDRKRSGEVDHTAIKKVQNIIAGKAQVEEGEYYDVTIGKLVASALAGDKAALKLVLSTPSVKLKVDGAAAEALSDGRATLSHLKNLNCL